MVLLKDIIEQIIEIDSLAYENKKKDEEFLKNKKIEFENKMIEYKRLQLESAKLEYQRIILQSDNFNNKISEEQIYNISKKIYEKYSQVESDIIKNIFEKLFIVVK